MYNGGGFIGIGEPTAYQHEGHYFQLANVLGVDKELGFSLSTDKYFINPVENHFISADSTQFNFGEGMKNIYALSEETEIIEYSNGEVHLSAHPFGEGRGCLYSRASIQRRKYTSADACVILCCP